MSNDKKNEFHGELLPPEVIRKSVYELGKVNRTPPTVGIFDAPTRCFVVNQEWWSHIAGMVHLLADVVSWKDAEDESYFAIQEILKFMQGVECMACETIVDCIETNEATILALQQMLSNAGFSPSGNSNSINGSTNVTMTDAAAAGNLLPVGYPCDDPQLMYTSRQIVLELHAAVNDFFEAVEFTTNPVEAVNIATDGIPVAGTVNNIPEFIDWMIETITESYNAAYNQEVEDTIACDIFCLARVDCEISYDMLISVYEPLAEGEFGTLPTDTNDFQAIVDWATGITMGISLGTVAAMHLLLLYAMKFGSGTVFEMSGLTSLKAIISMTVGYVDMSYEECDCVDPATPTTYWALYWDFRQSPFGTTQVGSPNAANTMYNNNGWCVNPAIAAGVSRVSWRYADLGAQYVIKAAASHQLRRGSIGNGSNDFSSTNFYPNANFTGTPTNPFGSSFLPYNDNDSLIGEIKAGSTGVYRSFQFTAGTSGDPNEPNPTGQLKVYDHVVWGVAGPGDTKPIGAVWVGNTLPTLVADLFPPFTP